MVCIPRTACRTNEATIKEEGKVVEGWRMIMSKRRRDAGKSPVTSISFAAYEHDDESVE